MLINLKPANQEYQPDQGVIFSIVYLWLEARKEGMPRTAAKIEEAVKCFFLDMKDKEEWNEDYGQLEAILDKIISAKKDEIANFLDYVIKK